MAKRKKFTLEIDTSNASFEDNPSAEMEKCLRDAIQYAEPDSSGRILDSNGNMVGNWRWDQPNATEDMKYCESCDFDTPAEDMMSGRSICVECYHDGQSMAEYDDYDQDYGDAPFRDPGGNSALRCGELEFDCPTCGAEKVLTQADVARGYQCDTCADKAEGTYRGADY